MTDRPMIFSGAMVRALIEGRWKQTTFPVNLEPYCCGGRVGIGHGSGSRVSGDEGERHASHNDTDLINYRVGDRLWVQEMWRPEREFDKVDANSIPPGSPIQYLYDEPLSPWDNVYPRQSIHMPRWASRLTMVVTDYLVRRLHEITCADAIAAGFSPAANSHTIDCDTPDPLTDYRAHWDAIGAPFWPWRDNPWVVTLKFAVHRRNIDQMEGHDHIHLPSCRGRLPRVRVRVLRRPYVAGHSWTDAGSARKERGGVVIGMTEPHEKQPQTERKMEKDDSMRMAQ